MKNPKDNKAAAVYDREITNFYHETEREKILAVANALHSNYTKNAVLVLTQEHLGIHHKYRTTNQHSDPSTEQMTHMFGQELTRLDPEFGAQFNSLKEIPAGEQAAQWSLDNPEKAELIYQVHQDAVQELGPGGAGRLAMHKVTWMTDSLNQQNAWNARVSTAYHLRKNEHD